MGKEMMQFLEAFLKKNAFFLFFAIELPKLVVQHIDKKQQNSYYAITVFNKIQQNSTKDGS